jgi:hypothetical protein
VSVLYRDNLDYSSFKKVAEQVKGQIGAPIEFAARELLGAFWKTTIYILNTESIGIKVDNEGN